MGMLRIMWVLVSVTQPLLAAPLPDDPRLDPVRADLARTVAQASARRLPDTLLTDKVREGLAKNVPPERIAQVVAKLAAALGDARAEARPFVSGTPPSALLKAIADANALGVTTNAVIDVLRAASP